MDTMFTVMTIQKMARQQKQCTRKQYTYLSCHQGKHCGCMGAGPGII